jgi:hypothetical protein
VAFTLRARAARLVATRLTRRANRPVERYPPGAGAGEDVVVVVSEVDGVVVVVVLVDDGVDVVVALLAGGGTGTPVVSVTVDVLVDTDVEAAADAGARTAHATRPPESPVANVSASGPGTPSRVYRCGMLAKLSGPS